MQVIILLRNCIKDGDNQDQTKSSRYIEYTKNCHDL